MLLSSRLMSEVALTADDLVVIDRGRILETTTVAAFVAEHSTHSIRVATPEPDKLHAVFETAPQVTVREVPRNANDPQQGRVFRIEGAALEPTAWAFTQAQYETRAIPGQVPAQYGEPAATYTQPNTQEVPRWRSLISRRSLSPCRSLSRQPNLRQGTASSRWPLLSHEVTPLAADEWRIPLIGLLVFKKSDIK